MILKTTQPDTDDISESALFSSISLSPVQTRSAWRFDNWAIVHNFTAAVRLIPLAREIAATIRSDHIEVESQPSFTQNPLKLAIFGRGESLLFKIAEQNCTKAAYNLAMRSVMFVNVIDHFCDEVDLSLGERRTILQEMSDTLKTGRPRSYNFLQLTLASNIAAGINKEISIHANSEPFLETFCNLAKIAEQQLQGRVSIEETELVGAASFALVGLIPKMYGKGLTANQLKAVEHVGASLNLFDDLRDAEHDAKRGLLGENAWVRIDPAAGLCRAREHLTLAQDLLSTNEWKILKQVADMYLMRCGSLVNANL